MKLLGVLFITLSGITPASSVFIIVPGILQTSGSGAFLSMVIAGIVGIFMAFVYAELSSAYPLTGGEYAIVGRVMGPFAGFVVLAILIVTILLVPAVLALGVSTYLGVLFPHMEMAPAGIVTVAIATICAILNIRTNAVITGLFLLLEILALIALGALGFLHVSRPLTDLIAHPVVLSQSHHLVAAPIAAIGMATSIAIFAYNGYGAAVYFGEETHDAPRHIARAILWALGITVFAELVPLTAVLMGAPDLRTLLGSQNMIGDFITSRGGNLANILISLGVALAILNAVIATTLQTARILFSTARDAVWTPKIDRILSKVHPTFHSPWVATLVCGILSALACLVNENILFVLTGTGLIFIYGALCIAAIIGRMRGTTAHGVYRMPLFPLAPVVALLVLLYVIYANFLDPVVGRPSLMVTIGIAIAAGIYYLAVLRRRGAWTLRGPED
ncbi:MAG TPA: APC family permease [Acidiphilium sp.]